MKLVILAAGKGTRLYPLTKDVPKALVPIKDKKLIDYVLSPFLSYISEIIFVINDNLGFKIEEYITDNHYGKKVEYVIQSTEDLKRYNDSFRKSKTSY
ncbi:MAG: sugar phosphate nucleotidyltransferase [Candidatus Paceibacterota bacterium]